MRWAFWRRSVDTSLAAPGYAEAPILRKDKSAALRVDPIASLRARTRRRLIGSAALLLLVVIMVPLILDPAPRPLSPAVPITLPNDKAPFAPRLALPDPGNVPQAPAPDSINDAATMAINAGAADKDRPADGSAGAAPSGAGPSGAAPSGAAPSGAAPSGTAPSGAATIASPAQNAEGLNSKPDTTASAKSVRDSAPIAKAAPRAIEMRKSTAERSGESRAAEAKATQIVRESELRKADEAKALLALEGKAADAAAVKTRYGVQAAALASESAARELSERIRKSGLLAYVERFQVAESVRWRVRVGPYSGREDAIKARARLREIGVDGTLVSL